jgi:hypothetical protein
MSSEEQVLPPEPSAAPAQARPGRAAEPSAEPSTEPTAEPAAEPAADALDSPAEGPVRYLQRVAEEQHWEQENLDRMREMRRKAAEESE